MSWVRYSFVTVVSSGKAVCAWECSGTTQTTGIQSVPTDANESRRTLRAAVSILSEHMATSPNLYVEFAVECDYTRSGFNQVSMWNPDSRMGGGRFKKHNDLWMSLKDCCSKGLQLRSTALPAANAVALKAAAFRYLSGIQKVPLPIGFGALRKLTKATFLKAIRVSSLELDGYNEEGAYLDRIQRLSERASQLGFRVGTAPKDGACFSIASRR